MAADSIAAIANAAGAASFVAQPVLGWSWPKSTPYSSYRHKIKLLVSLQPQIAQGNLIYKSN